MELKKDNKFEYWLWFAEKNQEELYYVISGMIDDKINEIVERKI